MHSKFVIAAVVAALLAVGAAAFSLTRRSRVELPPVAPAPPRIDDVAPATSTRR
ncbi:cell wall synthesis protein CwsA [Gordonia sp. TBRC 11910]|uniref:Cell wall synthesis protein CwsA n=1 Tax=Gordonia asplenii TaxID=2725283 RepID=A0A848KX11_9ACTN|nr:cell wall synthesis protein CwsA [Gordonia asplenii]NMO02617.1 cell wall synthesis protein CwsA [Gordonia asplenii]